MAESVAGREARTRPQKMERLTTGTFSQSTARMSSVASNAVMKSSGQGGYWGELIERGLVMVGRVCVNAWESVCERLERAARVHRLRLASSPGPV